MTLYLQRVYCLGTKDIKLRFKKSRISCIFSQLIQISIEQGSRRAHTNHYQSAMISIPMSPRVTLHPVSTEHLIYVAYLVQALRRKVFNPTSLTVLCLRLLPNKILQNVARIQIESTLSILQLSTEQLP